MRKTALVILLMAGFITAKSQDDKIDQSFSHFYFVLDTVAYQTLKTNSFCFKRLIRNCIQYKIKMTERLINLIIQALLLLKARMIRLISLSVIFILYWIQLRIKRLKQIPFVKTVYFMGMKAVQPPTRVAGAETTSMACTIIGR